MIEDTCASYIFQNILYYKNISNCTWPTLDQDPP